MQDIPLMERALRRDRLLLVALISTLFLLAGLYTLLGLGMEMTALQMTAMRDMRDMPGMATPGAWSAGHALLVFLMWWVMMVAMMLPSVAPTVLLNAALRRHARQAQAVPAISAAFLGGYLAVWAGFSLIATLTQWALEARGIVSATMMTLIDTLPGGLVLIAAGAFQFTPLKAACLTQCRDPIRFLTDRRRPGVTGAFRMGMDHGAYCLGCCWFLMALLFVGGIMNLYWIVGLATFVAVEKLAPQGARIARVTGAALILWGAVVVIRSL
jgi:predicted metal-binding membrane protein